MRTLPASFSMVARSSARSSAGSPSSIPEMVSPRSPVHIFSTPTTSTGDCPPRAAMIPMCRAEEPLAQELSTLTTPADPSPACRNQA